MAYAEFYESLRREPTAILAAAAPEYRWRLKADNGEIVASGEGHTRMEDAVRAFLDVAHLFAAMWALDVDEVDKTREDEVVVWRWPA